MRTGPLVRRGANASRTAQAATALPRVLPRAFGKQNLSLGTLPLPAIVPNPAGRSTCRLPINLRGFLAAQLGCDPGASDDTILSLAARADQLTLNKVARAIRRYSTARAHEAWAECSLAVTTFTRAYQEGSLVVLCLRCARVDFGEAASRDHRHKRCVPIMLGQPESSREEQLGAEGVAEKIQHQVEEFRALRAAFGLPHFELDCYVRGQQLTLMWRPLS
ncbi:MAG TPA: hypothetical protein VJ728_10755 [Candidatus Binataceae bacterium]|nr:hypothetical protein [Candidatus Binataceae bacterium]